MEIEEFTGSDIGFLRGGPWRATQAALAMLHRRGALALGATGTVHRLPASLAGCDSLERALYASVREPLGPAQLMARPDPHSALGLVRLRLIRAGLVRPPWMRLTAVAVLIAVPAVLLALLVPTGTLPTWVALPASLVLLPAGVALGTRRTFYAGRALRRLRTRHSGLRRPTDAGGLSPGEVGMAVALFGNRTLAAIIPEAAAAGLLRAGHRRHRPAVAAETGSTQYG